MIVHNSDCQRIHYWLGDITAIAARVSRVSTRGLFKWALWINPLSPLFSAVAAERRGTFGTPRMCQQVQASPPFYPRFRLVIFHSLSTEYFKPQPDCNCFYHIYFLSQDALPASSARNGGERVHHSTGRFGQHLHVRYQSPTVFTM